MKIAILGAGALGGRIGVQLNDAGYNVTLIDSWELHIKTIQESGLKVTSYNESRFVNIKAKLPKEVSESYDLVIVLTKAYDSIDMIQKLKSLGAIDENTYVLTMMNGLGHADRFSEVISRDKVIIAVTMWTAGLLDAGSILLEGSGSIEMNRADGENDSFVNKVNEAFNHANLDSTVSTNVFESIWYKASLNCVLNTFCTILDKRIGEFAHYEHTREMITPLLKEIVEVANAKNINIEFDKCLAKIEGAYPDEKAGLHYPSMHQDFNRGRLTEVDYLTGQVSKYGRELNIPTPNADLITHLVHQLEMKNK